MIQLVVWLEEYFRVMFNINISCYEKKKLYNFYLKLFPTKCLAKWSIVSFSKNIFRVNSFLESFGDAGFGNNTIVQFYYCYYYQKWQPVWQLYMCWKKEINLLTALELLEMSTEALVWIKPFNCWCIGKIIQLNWYYQECSLFICAFAVK